jgi:hypothetical protein
MCVLRLESFSEKMNNNIVYKRNKIDETVIVNLEKFLFLREILLAHTWH